MNDPFYLQRFVYAQDPVFEEVCAELRRGRKDTHWMWFVFPQLKGLGHSAMAKAFAISSQAEAQAYLQHSILGPRLITCVGLMNLVKGRSIDQILGFPDSLKFRSSMTLFAKAAPENTIFVNALQKYFAGQFDQMTLDRL